VITLVATEQVTCFALTLTKELARMVSGAQPIASRAAWVAETDLGSELLIYEFSTQALRELDRRPVHSVEISYPRFPDEYPAA
jgi:hypothetical protein